MMHRPVRALATMAMVCLGLSGSAKVHASECGGKVPAQVAQGGLLLGVLPEGSRLSFWSASPPSPGAPRAVRVGASGAFVIGAGRDETGPLVLKIDLPDGTICEREVLVQARQWKIERIEGVPESTVNPPPAIAARIEAEQARVAGARERDDEREDFAGGFDWPLTGRISGVYGSQRVYNGTPKSPHSGLDVAAAKGTPVLAPAAGIISFAEPDLYLTGGTVLIDHGHGLSSNFLHLSRLDVAVGQRVAKGERIGLVGATGRATGPHMHWGLNWFGVRLDPRPLLDPLRNPVASPATATPSP